MSKMEQEKSKTKVSNALEGNLISPSLNYILTI